MHGGLLGLVSAGACLAAVASCASGGSCSSADLSMRSCASSLDFDGHLYVEFTIDRPIPRGEELGDGGYPACADTGDCGDESTGDPGPSGFATDVWRLDDVDPSIAVVGLREGTHTYVVFARPNTDPETLLRMLHAHHGAG